MVFQLAVEVILFVVVFLCHLYKYRYIGLLKKVLLPNKYILTFIYEINIYIYIFFFFKKGLNYTYIVLFAFFIYFVFFLFSLELETPRHWLAITFKHGIWECLSLFCRAYILFLCLNKIIIYIYIYFFPFFL